LTFSEQIHGIVYAVMFIMVSELTAHHVSGWILATETTSVDIVVTGCCFFVYNIICWFMIVAV